MTDATEAYCAELARRYDNDRYLAALFAPAEKRPSLMALYAFNIEVAKTRETVTETLIGRMRLQWWRETIDALYAGVVRQSEVAVALARAIERGNLSRARFQRLIDAREQDLDDSPPATLAWLEAYAEATGGALAELTAEALGAGAGPAIAVACDAGTAWALIGRLRIIAYNARANRCLLPTDLLARVGLSEADVIAGRCGPALRDVMAAIADRARLRIAAVRGARAHRPRSVLPALLPLAIGELCLGRLARAGFDPFAPALEPSRLARQLAVAHAGILARY